MKKLIIVVAVAMLLCLLFSAMAFAQYDEDQPSRLNLRIGLLKPTDSLTKSATNSKWSLEELTYDVKGGETGHPKYQLSLGLLSPFSISGTSMIKVGVDRMFWKPTKGDSSLFFGVGGGLYKTRALGKTKLNTGAELFLGYSFHDAYTLEVRDLIVSPMTIGSGTSAFDLNFSGLMMCVSTRKLF